MPTIPSIRTSVENKDVLVLDNHAKNGTFERDARGRLIAYTGGFSVVFPYRTANGEKWAFRCWHSDIKNTKKRYETISDTIKKANLSFLCEFQYIDKGINVEGHIYPTTRMRWIDGMTIKDYICQNRNSKKLLIALADNFLKMTQALHAQSLAHGDLQHGNILVNKNHQLYLVDYDSFYCPQLKGEADTVTGLADYQHPARISNKSVSEKLDYFSELIIYLSILAIAEAPSLADKYKVADADRLLFSKEDFVDIKNAPIYKDIYALGNDFRDMLAILEDYLGHKSINDLAPYESYMLHRKVCDSPREISSVELLKKNLKEKYSEAAYKTFIRYHYELLASADKGDPNAQYQVANWFFERGKTHADEEYRTIAFFWYNKAATRGQIDAQIMLASCFRDGIGVTKSKFEALKWFKTAASSGNSIAEKKMLELKYDVDAYKSVIRYQQSLLASADKGHTDSQLRLANWFMKHAATNSMYKTIATYWYLKAANNDNVEAMNNIASCYCNGVGVERNYLEAIKWYKCAAKKGSKKSCQKLAHLYLYGFVGLSNVDEAIKWFERCAEEINKEDLYKIALSYLNGNGVAQNPQNGLLYLRRSAEKGHTDAQYRLGLMYENGNIVEQDHMQAKSWFERAADQGHEQAKYHVSKIQYGLYTKEQENKGCLTFFVTGIVALIGLVLLLNQSDDSWTHNKLIFDYELGTVVWVCSIYLTYLIAKNITGFDE